MVQKRSISVCGYVVTIGPKNNLNFFTGNAYSAHLNEAQVFRTDFGGLSAARYWQTAEHNPRPLAQSVFGTLQALPVALSIAEVG